MTFPPFRRFNPPQLKPPQKPFAVAPHAAQPGPALGHHPLAALPVGSTATAPPACSPSSPTPAGARNRCQVSETTPSRHIWINRLTTWSFLTAANLATMGMSFVASVTMTHRLTEADYGAVTLGMSISAIVSLLVRFGSDRLLVRDIIQHPSEKHAYLTASYTFRALLAAALMLAALQAANTHLFPKTWPKTVVLIFFALSCIHGLNPTEVFDAHNRMRQHACVEACSNSAYAVAVLALLLLGPPQYHTALSVGLIRLTTVALGCVAQTWLISDLVRVPAWWQTKDAIRRTLVPSVTVLGASLGSTLMCQLPSVHLSVKAGTGALAPYGAAMSLASVPCLTFLQLARVLGPERRTQHPPGEGFDRDPSGACQIPRPLSTVLGSGLWHRFCLRSARLRCVVPAVLSRGRFGLSDTPCLVPYWNCYSLPGHSIPVRSRQPQCLRGRHWRWAPLLGHSVSVLATKTRRLRRCPRSAREQFDPHRGDECGICLPLGKEDNRGSRD